MFGSGIPPPPPNIPAIGLPPPAPPNIPAIGLAPAPPPPEGAFPKPPAPKRPAIGLALAPAPVPVVGAAPPVVEVPVVDPREPIKSEYVRHRVPRKQRRKNGAAAACLLGMNERGRSLVESRRAEQMSKFLQRVGGQKSS